MHFKTEILYKVDKNLWNDTLKLNTASTASQMYDTFRPHQLTFDSKPVFIIISNPSGEIVGQLSTIIHINDYWLDTNIISKLINSKFNLGSTMRWSHGPIIHDQENSNEILSDILSAVDKIAADNNVNLISGTTPPQVSAFPVNTLKNNGYAIKPWISYITDLQRNVDDIYHALHNKTRYDIRKGEKLGLEFEVSSTRESIDIYRYVKYHDKKKIEQVRKKNKKFTDNIWKVLFQNGYKKNFIVRYEGNPIAVINNFLFNGNVSQVGVATSSEASKYAGAFLTWNTIRWAAENNYRTYDVGGANPSPISKKEQGINLFKSKWASKKVDYFICTKVFNKTKLNISNIIKQPKSIKHKINKKIIKMN